MPRIVFAVTGASGIPLAREVLALYRQLPDLEIHLIVSRASRETCLAECGCEESRLMEYAHAHYSEDHLSAPPASGSWQHSGMIVCPCSMNSLACIANGFGSNLVHRSADVTLKERRPLLLVARETPLNLTHLRNMVLATENGAIIMPFMPAFYTSDTSLQGAMKNFAGRMLDLLKIPNNLCQRWCE